MRTTAALTCCLLVVLCTGATAAVGTPSTASTAAPDAADSTHAPDTIALQTEQTDELNATEDGLNTTEFVEITIEPDGDARFVLAKEFPTETSVEQTAFERLANEYENGEHGDLGFSAYEAAFDRVAANADREMELVDDGRHVTRSDGIGRLEYRFTWSNFATVGEETVVVGDAFDANGSTWLGLYDGQRLEIRAPDGYAISESPSGPEIDDDALIWTGPATFQSGDLSITFEESTGSSSAPFGSVLLGIVAIALVVAVLVGAWLLVVRLSDDRTARDRIGAITGQSESGSNAGGAADPGGKPDDHGTGGDPPTKEAAAAVSDTAPSASSKPADPDPASDAVDPELLSDEERVEQLLEQNGGRMKQANIVTETGWSNAKVSQLLSKMDDTERVDKLRIGRENLITLPDVDVTDRE